MAVDRQWVRNYLQTFDFESLFIEELGWDQVDLNMIPVGDEDVPYQAEAIAQKRGMVVYHCQPQNGGEIPDNGLRRKIDHQMNSYSREHLIIYSDAAQQEQVWQWVRREKGKPLALREYLYHISQDGESLVQKLTLLAIDLDEEDDLTTVDVKTRAKQAFDVDKVTKKFYERFQQEHKRFLGFVTGIQERFDQEWYCSVMLNRLMFVYFLQKKEFLDGDINYLRNRLSGCQRAHGDDEFYSFYRYFLLRLFHEGLGDSKRDSAELERLIGKLPYLNGGLFDVHELEERNPDIQIPDEAFEAIFDFFDDYQWHLDDRPLRNDKEINPDVLGYIFEKYINQKQMGAYYTKEDITEYISKNTIIPFLLDAAKKACAIAFEPDGPVWRLLRENPERYLYEAVKKGVIREDAKTKTAEVMALPPEIEVGIADVSQRGAWNRLAEADYALPTELWREHVARRLRCLEIREKLASGEVCEVNDLITYNLDIRQFAQDVIEQCEGPELLRAFYKAISQISVLDPTCGSGAFLFAALNILEPLYDACLRRMKGFVEDLDRSEEKSRPEKFSDFRKILEQVAKHPNREYFILKSIILGNLYGVDIMEEAVEICKLRLFLKLVSQVDAKAEKPNYGLEPLPDIDFNIRAGNTLVGFATRAEVRRIVEKEVDGQQKFDLYSDMPRIDESAEIVDRAFQMFRKQQTDYDMEAADFKNAKVELGRRLKELNDKLNRYLAGEYGVNADEEKSFEEWLKSHTPFHWFVEFYQIITDGGFDIIVGNPPYLERSKLRKLYSPKGMRTIKCKDIYAWVVERSFSLKSKPTRTGLIIPVSISSSGSFQELRDLVSESKSYTWLSHFANRPGQLFEGAQNRLTIFLQHCSVEKTKFYSTQYYRWDARRGEREVLFENIEYVSLLDVASSFHGLFPKIGNSRASSIIEKIHSVNLELKGKIQKNSSHSVYWVRVPGYFCQFFTSPPMAYPINGDLPKQRGELNTISFANESHQRVVHSLLNSSFYYQFFCAYTDGRHINPSDVKDFPLDINIFSVEDLSTLCKLSKRLDQSMKDNTSQWKKSGLLIESVDSKLVKPVIDEIDTAIARVYKLSDNELDFVINYDIKYRMGLDSFENN